MAEGMNRVILIGNLGQDPELRGTSADDVLTLRMATSESYLDTKSNERKEITEWHTVVIWGKRATALNKILSKGSRIAVEGKLRTRSWEDKNGGGKRYATEIKADNVILLGGRGQGEGAGRGRHEEGPGLESGSGYSDFPEPPGDDDIPF